MSRIGVGEGLGKIYSIHVFLIVKNFTQRFDPTGEIYIICPFYAHPLLLNT